MAVYHGDDAKSFRSALDSVIYQEFREPLEARVYLAVDGPISEKLEAELEQVEKLLFCLVRLEKNSGLASALNALISRLEDEEFVFRMDADDVALRDRYQKQLDYLTEKPDIDILGTDIWEVDSQNGSRRCVCFSRGPEEARKNLIWRVPVAHPTVCFRRVVLDTVVGYPNVVFNEDIALWIECSKLGFKFDNVPEPLLEFNVSNNFWYRRSISKSIQEWKCYTYGGWQLNGLSWRLILPTLRLGLRFAPHWLSKLAYSSRLRRR